MDLGVKSDRKQVGVAKQVFQLKTSRKDGMILQIHHTIPGVNGEIRRIRFVHVAFDETGEQLTAADHRGNIFVIDLASSKFWLLINVGSCTVMAYSTFKKNEVLVGTLNGTLNFVNTELGKISGSLQGHTVPVTQVSFAQSKFCLSTSSQEAIIWDLSSNCQAHRLSMRNDVLVKQVMFMPVTNHILACFQDDAMHIWKLESFECFKQIIPEAWKSHHIKSIAFTRNGRAMVIGGHSPSLVIFSLDNWTVKKVIELPEGMTGVRHIEFLPQLFDGGANKILGVLSTNCTVHFIDTESFAFLSVRIEPDSGIRIFTSSPHGKYIACVLRSGEVNVYSCSKLMDEAQAIETVPSVERAKPQPQETRSEATEQKKACHRKMKHTSQQHLNQVQKQIQETLGLQRLRPILKEFGEYPESYRALIWKTILQHPHNQSAFVGLVNRDCHSAYIHLEEQYPLENRSILKNLKRLLSNLAYWSPLFGEVKYLPHFVFPFVKVFQNDPFTCFEAVATIIVNWCQHWFEYFPFPPVNVLAMIENVLAEHDPELVELYYKAGVTSQLYAWPLLEVAFSEVLSTSEWLQLWDHVLSNEPSFLLMVVVAYNITCRSALHTCQNYDDFEYFFHNQNPIDMKGLIAKSYLLCRKTSDTVHPRQYLSAFTPLSKNVYPVFNQYPKFIVDYQAQQMDHIRKEEEDMFREQQLNFGLKEAQEKRMKEHKQAEVQEARLLKMEEAYREILQREEERVAIQRQKITTIRRDLRARELELLAAARDKMLQQNTRERAVTLDRLLDDIARKRAREETELESAEEELMRHFTSLMVHKQQLQNELGLPHQAVSAPTMEHKILQQQQELLQMELRKLREEATSEHHTRQLEMSSRIAAVDNLLQRVEVELAQELANRQNNLISSQGNIKVMQLETKTKSLENEVQHLLDKLAEIRLVEGRAKLDEIMSSRADRQELNQEQWKLTRKHLDQIRSQEHQDMVRLDLPQERNPVQEIINKGKQQKNCLRDCIGKYCLADRQVLDHEERDLAQRRCYELRSQQPQDRIGFNLSQERNQSYKAKTKDGQRINSLKDYQDQCFSQNQERPVLVKTRSTVLQSGSLQDTDQGSVPNGASGSNCYNTTGYDGRPPSLVSENSLRSNDYYACEQNAVRAAMSIREQLVSEGSSTTRSWTQY